MSAASERSTRVCPRCGNRAGDQEFCATCGLALQEQRELPTREQWERNKAASPSAFRRVPLRAPPKADTVEYLRNAAYWMIGLSLLMPLLALPAWGFAFLIILRGRLDTGVWLFFLSAFVAAAAAVFWVFILGGFDTGGGGSSSSY